MRMIQKFVEAIDEEIEGAKEYAEKYVEHKVSGHMEQANRYKEMANDELKHAMYQHEWAVHKIDELSKHYTPPVEMLEKWEKAHKLYVEEVAGIRQMLSM
jgi:hypothetical protein